MLARINTAVERKYSAEVLGFDNWNEYSYEGIKPGDQIALIYDNIFGCSR